MISLFLIFVSGLSKLYWAAGVIGWGVIIAWLLNNWDVNKRRK